MDLYAYLHSLRFFALTSQRFIFHYLSHFSEIQVASGEWMNGSGHHNQHPAAAHNVGGSRHYAPRHNGLGVGQNGGVPPSHLGGVVKGKGGNLYVSATPAELVRRGNVKRSWTISSKSGRLP